MDQLFSNCEQITIIDFWISGYITCLSLVHLLIAGTKTRIVNSTRIIFKNSFSPLPTISDVVVQMTKKANNEMKWDS